MSKVLKIENHFYGSVGQHIDHVGSMNVTFDKDMNMHIDQLDELHTNTKNESQPSKPTCADVTYCEYIHRANLREQGLYSLDEFERMIAKAVKEPSTQFADFLKKYKSQGNLDFHGQNKKQIFEYFREHYPQMRAYRYNTFAAAF